MKHQEKSMVQSKLQKADDALQPNGHVFSVGYHRKTWKGFLQLLGEHRITLVVDVRSIPRSKYNPAFNIGNLETQLGSRYQWVQALGGKTGKRQPGYWQALKELAARSQLGRICLMCLESNPDRCHRKRWIAADLERLYGIKTKHL